MSPNDDPGWRDVIILPEMTHFATNDCDGLYNIARLRQARKRYQLDARKFGWKLKLPIIPLT